MQMPPSFYLGPGFAGRGRRRQRNGSAVDLQPKLRRGDSAGDCPGPRQSPASRRAGLPFWLEVLVGVLFWLAVVWLILFAFPGCAARRHEMKYYSQQALEQAMREDVPAIVDDRLQQWLPWGGMGGMGIVGAMGWWASRRVRRKDRHD